MIKTSQSQDFGGCILRPVKKEDSFEMVNLSRQLGYLVAENELGKRIENLLKDKDHCIYTAVDQSGLLLGWIHGFIRRLLIVPLHIEIGGLVVLETKRGMGIGSKLLFAVENWGRKQGISTIYVRSNATRERAHHFYKSNGYQFLKSSLVFIKD